MGILVRWLFMSTSLLPEAKRFPCHGSTLPDTLSTTSSSSMIVKDPFEMGTPRYLTGMDLQLTIHHMGIP